MQQFERASFHIGVDVGGTFTDLVGLDDRSGRIYRAKLLTSPSDPERAIMDGIRRLLDYATGRPEDITTIVHGTTLAANALIERKGARVGVLTTEGHRDTLEMGYEFRYDLYDLSMTRAEPLVPRWLRLGIMERIDAEGTVLRPLDEAGVVQAAKALVGQGIESLAICFLHSYRNPVHEQRAQSLVKELYPRWPVTTSSNVAPEMREYDRFSTAIVNAYVQPLLDRYLHSLEQRLREFGVRGRFYVMFSNGGVGSVDAARTFPVHMVESGPAGGILAAVHLGRSAGCRDVLTFDMGGTTAKLSIVEDGAPRRSHSIEVARVHRFKRGSGLPLRIPVMEMIELGAGGGSIAWIDDMGLLKVGPQSAGALPGPAAYAQGGILPTVTDADLLLGMLNPEYFLGGEIKLDLERAQHAVDEHVASRLGMDPLKAAAGIHSVVNENMAQAARMHLAERGVDPKKFALVASGGAGPVHAYGLAKSLKLERFVCPPGAGVASALGLLLSPPTVELVRASGQAVDALDQAEAQRIAEELIEEAMTRLEEIGVGRDAIKLRWLADMRHVGQGFEVSVPVSTLPVSNSELLQRFGEWYEKEFGRRIDGVPVEVMAWRLSAAGPVPHIDVHNGSAPNRRAKVKDERMVTLPGLGEVRCPIYDRYALQAGDAFTGPAIIEERESTIVVGPDASFQVDEHGNVVAEIVDG